MAPFKAIVGGGWSNDTFGFDLSSKLSAGMLTDHLNTPVTNTNDTTFDAHGYAIIDLNGWWTPEQLPGLLVQAGVYNIFDQKYFNALAVRDVNLVSRPHRSLAIGIPSRAVPSRCRSRRHSDCRRHTFTAGEGRLSGRPFSLRNRLLRGG